MKEQWRWMSCSGVRAGGTDGSVGEPSVVCVACLPASRHLETCYEIVMIGTHQDAAIVKLLLPFS